MKLIRILNRSIRDSFKSIFRNFSLSLASMSCTIITLILVSLAMLASYNVTSMTEKIEKDLTVVVFVDKNATYEDINIIKNQIKNIDNINEESIIYRSKEDIKNMMSDESEAFKNILSSYTEEENPLQSTFVLKVDDIRDIKETAVSLKNIDKVTLVKYGETMVDTMINVFDIVRKICLIIVVALIIVTAFLINNTIKITIFSRRNEINIMRLVGTSNTVIKLPFLFEGLLLGAMGSLIPILVTMFGYTYLYESMGGVVFSNLVELATPSSIIYSTSLLLLIIGSGVGMIGSLRAVRKYLKI
ncbi:MAG: permease-like cell division protein FtsX [Bacilli bacterium]|nr:permease-like cell division protein FtsX [Bacilli bacterium]